MPLSGGSRLDSLVDSPNQTAVRDHGGHHSGDSLGSVPVPGTHPSSSRSKNSKIVRIIQSIVLLALALFASTAIGLPGWFMDSSNPAAHVLINVSLILVFLLQIIGNLRISWILVQRSIIRKWLRSSGQLRRRMSAYSTRARRARTTSREGSQRSRSPSRSRADSREYMPMASPAASHEGMHFEDENTDDERGHRLPSPEPLHGSLPFGTAAQSTPRSSGDPQSPSQSPHAGQASSYIARGPLDSAEAEMLPVEAGVDTDSAADAGNSSGGQDDESRQLALA